MHDLAVFEKGDALKQSIIFVHGFPFNHEAWEAQIEAFSNDYHCVSYDVRGLGASLAGNGQFTMERFVDDLFAIIQEKKIEKPILCGHSMGGYIVLRALEKDQSSFLGAIFCNTVSKADNNEGKLKRAGAIKEIEENGLENFTEGFLEKAFTKEFQKTDPETISRWKSAITSFNPVGVKGALLAMLSRTDTTSSLEKLTIPTLFIGGDKDEITPPDTMIEMSKEVPNSIFGLIENVGHMAIIEDPKSVNSKTEEFLQELK